MTMLTCLYCYSVKGQKHTPGCPVLTYPDLSTGCYVKSEQAAAQMIGACPQDGVWRSHDANGSMRHPDLSELTGGATDYPSPPASFITSNEFKLALAQFLAAQGVHRATGVRPSTLAQIVSGQLAALAASALDRSVRGTVHL